MKTAVYAIVQGAVLACTALPAATAELKLAASDTLESVLGAQKDKRATLRLRSGQELTGTVKLVNARIVQLAAPTGREFFDAVVPLDRVEAVLIRTKD